MNNLYLQMKKDLKQNRDLYTGIFISTIIIGILTHLYIFVNKFFNIDDIMYIGQTEIDHLSTGRWLIGILTKISSNYSMPWVIGILSVFFLAFTSIVMCSILKIRYLWSGILIGGLLVTYPSIAGNFSYMFLADGYSESVFFAVLGVYFLRISSLNRRDALLKGMFSVFCLTLSLAVYQAYFCLSIGLILICLISDCARDIQDARSWFNLIKKGVCYLVILAGSLFLYLITVYTALYLTGTELTSYQNIDKAMSLSFGSLILGFYNAYKNFFLFIQTKDFGNFNFTLYVVHLAMVMTSICFGVYGLCTRLKTCIDIKLSTQEHGNSHVVGYVNRGGGKVFSITSADNTASCCN